MAEVVPALADVHCLLIHNEEIGVSDEFVHFRSEAMNSLLVGTC